MRVCPYLRKRGEREYVCSVIGQPVNPFLAPCLSDFDECPFYKEGMKKEREKEEKKEEKAEVKEEIKEEKPAAPAPPPAPPAEASLEELAESVETRVREIEEAIQALNSLWKTYEDAARKVINSWMGYRRMLECRLSGLRRKLEEYETMLNEVETRRLLGMIDDGVYNQTVNELQEELGELRAQIEQLESIIKRVDELLEEHYRRVRPRMIKLSLEAIREGLARLEAMYRDGKISRELYERLRRELEEDYNLLAGGGAA